MRSKTLHLSRAAMSRMLSSTLPKVFAEADEMRAEHDVEAHRVGLAHRIVLLYLKCMNMYLQRAFVVLWETSGRFVVLRETSGRCPARRYQL